MGLFQDAAIWGEANRTYESSLSPKPALLNAVAGTGNKGFRTSYILPSLSSFSSSSSCHIVYFHLW
jgi:hypothetical protein